jgi:hypothetical protein
MTRGVLGKLYGSFKAVAHHLKFFFPEFASGVGKWELHQVSIRGPLEALVPVIVLAHVVVG